MAKTILITGAGSGLGEGVAIGLAQNGHDVIATTQIAPQVAALREKVSALGLANVRVEKLDILDPYDVAYALGWTVDILFNNAGIGECGPVSEIPPDLVRRCFETNLFAPLHLTQGFIRKWVEGGKAAKIVFCSSICGLVTPANFGVYSATQHALGAVATAMFQELRPFGIRVQMINPGNYLTGFNETMADTPFRWLDDERNFVARAAVRAVFDDWLGTPEGRRDPGELIEAAIEIIASDEGRFRNVLPVSCEEDLKESQGEAWSVPI